MRYLQDNTINSISTTNTKICLAFPFHGSGIKLPNDQLACFSLYYISSTRNKLQISHYSINNLQKLIKEILGFITSDKLTKHKILQDLMPTVSFLTFLTEKIVRVAPKYALFLFLEG